VNTAHNKITSILQKQINELKKTIISEYQEEHYRQNVAWK